ncbi:MAG: Asp-tRNA(Asn)/Glu-tRNA(Gln) amidotransferase subunit GatC [Candidatus Promineifilaceae bacterium]
MSLSRDEVERIAHLARLALTEAQIIEYQVQLSAVLDYAEMLNELDIGDVEPTAHAIAQQNVVREDKIEPSLPIEEVLQNTVAHRQRQFYIQSVLGE